MAFYKEQNTRIRLKRTATSGATPSVGPSPNHTDGTWGINDIYGGEFYWNMYDQALWLGWNTGTTSGVTLIYSGGTGGGGGVYTADNGLSENPTNNFQWGGTLVNDVIIDGVGSWGITFQALKEFYLYSDKNVYLYAQNGGQTGIVDIDPQTNQYLEISYDDGTDFTCIRMNGAKMVIKTPDFAAKNNGDVLTLIDNISGEVEYAPAPGTDVGSCITDFYVTNIHGCSPINMLDDVICQSGLTATTISATTYQNLPVSAVTGSSGISATTSNGVVTLSAVGNTGNYFRKTNAIRTGNITGGIAEVKIYSMLVPANTITAGSVIYINGRYQKGATANGNCVARMYFNTTDAIGGTQIMIRTNGVNNLEMTHERRLSVNTLTTTRFYGPLSTTTADTDTTSANGQFIAGTIDWSIDQYLIFSIQPAGASDVFNGVHLKLEVDLYNP